MYELSNVIRKSGFMDSNLLECDTLTASSCSVGCSRSPIGLLTKMRDKENPTFFALYFCGSLLQ